MAVGGEMVSRARREDFSRVSHSLEIPVPGTECLWRGMACLKAGIACHARRCCGMLLVDSGRQGCRTQRTEQKKEDEGEAAWNPLTSRQPRKTDRPGIGP
jgi:hypothetical protein